MNDTMTDYLRDGASIYAESFRIIRAEADLSRFTQDEARVVVRMIHGCGMVGITDHIIFSADFFKKATQALEKGAPILCDSMMVAQGVTRARLPARNEVICTLRHPDVPDLAQHIGHTRSAAAVDLWLPQAEGALIVIGNAPTALFRVMAHIRAGAMKPAAIIGMPVGFVGAAESKEAVAHGAYGPHAIVRGRLGGSALAASCVNALASPRED